MGRLLLTAVLLVAGWSTAIAQETAYGPSHTFAAFRNGQRIGTHTVNFQWEGHRLVVSTTVDFAVKVMGLTAYRYAHRGREVWNGNDLLTVETSTNDDGKQYIVRVARQGESLVLDRKSPGVAEGFRQTLPPGVLPSTHWNVRQTMQSQLLNSQKGTLDPIRVTALGREFVATASGTVEATRYHYDGDINMDQWFDGRGRWVKTTFIASDGSQIEYVLQ